MGKDCRGKNGWISSVFQCNKYWKEKQEFRRKRSKMEKGQESRAKEKVSLSSWRKMGYNVVAFGQIEYYDAERI
jgi:hypothetical protein